jgi:hypothetical protein
MSNATKPSRRRRDDGNAFLPDPGQGARSSAPDDLAEVLGEEYVASATAGEDVNEDVRDEIVPEELGGPFVEAAAQTELADDVDASNPEGAEPEPFPTAVHVPRRD